MKRTKRLQVANARDKQEEVCSDLLIGLPEPAAQCIIQQLMQRGGRQLTELFSLCRTTRGMVLQHVRGAYYTPGRHGRHEGLHTFATRGVPTSLTVDLDGTDEEVFANILKDAAGKRSGRGWNINSLKLEGNEDSLDWQWGHLLGHACPQLESLQLCSLTIDPSFYLSIGSCRHLTHLQLCQHVELTATAARDAVLLASAAPQLASLSIRAKGHAPVLTALAPQLTKLQLWDKHQPMDEVEDTDWAMPAVAACAKLQAIHLGICMDQEWYSALCQLPCLTDVHVNMVSDLMARSGPGGRPAQPWQSLVVDVLPISAFKHLPLGHIRKLHVVILIADLDYADELNQGASALRAAAGHMGQGPGSTSSAEIHWDRNLALVDEDGSEQAAPLAATLRSLLEAMGSTHGAKEHLNIVLGITKPRTCLFGAAEVAAVKQCIGRQLKSLVLCSATVGKLKVSPLLWSAVLQLPALERLVVRGLKELDSMALAMAATAAQRPLRVAFVGPIPHKVVSAMEATRSLLQQQGVDSPMQFDCVAAPTV